MNAEVSGRGPTRECLIGDSFERRGLVDWCREVAKNRQGYFRGSQSSSPRRDSRTGKNGKGGGRMMDRAAELSSEGERTGWVPGK